MAQISSSTRSNCTKFKIFANQFVKDRLKELGLEVVYQQDTVLFDQQQININLKINKANLHHLLFRYYARHWAKYSDLHVHEIDLYKDDFECKTRFINSTAQNSNSRVNVKDVKIHSFYACFNNNVKYLCETDGIVYVINNPDSNEVNLTRIAQLNQESSKQGRKLHFILPQISQDTPKDSDIKDDIECVRGNAQDERADQRIIVESVFCDRKYAIRGLF